MSEDLNELGLRIADLENKMKIQDEAHMLTAKGMDELKEEIDNNTELAREFNRKRKGEIDNLKRDLGSLNEEIRKLKNNEKI